MSDVVRLYAIEGVTWIGPVVPIHINRNSMPDKQRWILLSLSMAARDIPLITNHWLPILLQLVIYGFRRVLQLL